MKHGSLFSGIGGFDLASEWMGWENIFHCEWMPFPRKVLDYYWPNADSHIDICKTDFTKYANKIDILTGGFPCQPFSLAGKRKGTNDERYLWGEMLRSIQEIKPKYLIAENVFGITNIDGGLVFEQVCLDLETEGYEVQPFIIPAASKNAPHRRDRVWFVAYSNGATKKCESRTNNRKTKEVWREKESNVFTEFCGNGNATDTKVTRSKRQCFTQSGKVQSNRRDSSYLQTEFFQFPTQSPICGRDDGLPTKLDGITFPKWRAESIKGYGNAIVPQVAYEIFKSIIKTQ